MTAKIGVSNQKGDVGKTTIAINVVGALNAVPPKPFGVLYFHPFNDPQTSHLLWTDAYKTSQYVKTEGREVTMVLDIGLSAKLLPKQCLRQSFVLDQSDLTLGTYVIESNVGISTVSGGGGTFPSRVVFSIKLISHEIDAA